MKTIYLFYGFGGEYVLHKLFLLMSPQYNCVEIDALSIKNSKVMVDKLRGQSVVFVTSAHFLLDKRNFTDFYPNKNQFYSVIEIISLLEPIKSIYVPHDLTQPLIAHEIEYLNQFDLFLSPCEPYTTAYSSICPTVEVGWIKYPNKTENIKASNKAIWFLSDFIIHIKMGKEKSYKSNVPLLNQGVSIKFPVWENSLEFTDYYRKQGVDVYNPEIASINLIKCHDIIFTNGLSSLVAESYLSGKTTVNIMENSHYGDDGIQTLETAYPDLQIYTKIADININSIALTSRMNLLHPFDIDLAIKLITSTD